MAKFKVGDRVVVVKENPNSGLNESHFIGETGEVVEVIEVSSKDYVSIKFDNHTLKGLWSCNIPGAKEINRRFRVDCIEPEPACEDFFDQLSNILSL